VGFVLRAKADLFAGAGVFGVKTPARLNRMNLDFIDDSLNQETSPVSSAFMNVSFGEFQLVLANSGEL
jgi:hypothetical protein